MTNIIQTLQDRLSSAKGSHSSVMTYIEESRYNYEADSAMLQRNNQTGGKTVSSGFRMKDIKRAVESSIPDITSPFLNTDTIIDIPDDEDMAEYINYQFSKGTKNRIELLEIIARDIQVEGTVFTKIGLDGDMPTISNVQASELVLDPSARSMPDLGFAIQRRKVTVQSILDNPEWYTPQTLESLSAVESVSSTEYDDARYQNNGFDSSYNFEERASQLVETFEFYGQLDIGNGLEPVLCIWSDETLLRATPSPYPASWNGIPFEKAVYQRRSYNIYGDSLPHLINDYQSIRDALMRDVINNASNANVGQMFIKKGGMDQMNFRRMANGEKHIYMNSSPSETIMHGEFNEIPSSVFALMEGMKTEQEELSGIGRMNAGVDSRALNSGTTATAVSLANDNSAKRILQITRHISEMLERIFYKWIDLNYMVLGMEPKKVDIEIKVGTSGIKQQKLQNIQLMTQALTGTGRQVPDSILIEMAELLEMPKVAEELQAQSQQPNPMQQMAAQLEIQEKQSEINENNANAQQKQADAMNKFVDAELKSFGL